MFTHLHTHSHFSFLDGLASPLQLAQTAARLEMPALALTDFKGLTGAIEFYAACREQSVQPLLGLELPVAAPQDTNRPAAAGNLLLLALDLEGWGSLCRLSSAVNGGLETLPFESLAEQNRGLLCLSGGLRGPVNHLLTASDPQSAADYLSRLAEIFPGRLYVELQIHASADAPQSVHLAALAHRLRLPTVATHNVHYLQPEQASLQRLVTAIRLNQPLSALPPEAPAPPGAYFTSPQEMQQRFAVHLQALEASAEIAARCRLELPLDKALFPAIDLPAGQTALQALRQRAWEGARRLYGHSQDTTQGETSPPELPPEVAARLEYELGVIGERDYASLFLIMQEILNYARSSGVPTASRGSASSSLVAHCLGITSPDPLKLNLYFERFLNPARRTPPDIDVDLCSRRRDGVIDFVYQRFGRERVAMVSTINRFRRRSALREVAKAYGLPAREVSALAESLPERWYGPPDAHTSHDDPYAGLAKEHPSSQHQEIFRQAAALIGQPDHLSIHPGGVVIAPGRLTDLAPTLLAAKGVLITQFDLESIQRLGLVKMDLLGIRGLSVLGDVADHQRSRLRRRLAQTGETRLDFLGAIPEDDPLTSEAVRQGSTIGCFQIESPGMRATLRQIQAHSLEDILVALALYRPGPLTGGLKDAFVRRHLGLETPSQLHPALTPLLADTYGVILYQEQVLRIAHELAGLSLADADLLRRAMSHFDPGKQMQTIKERFIAGAGERRNVPEAIAERVWELMAAFAGYGFPKAHAASYAQVAWRAAWCKCHYPAVFMAAVLANWGGFYGQSNYLTEARRMGLMLRPPQVNHAGQQFSMQIIEGQEVLFMGLDQVRDLTRRAQTRILRERPFHSLDDFLARVDPRPLEAENLAKAGALREFGPIPALLAGLRQGGWRAGQLPLFPLEISALEDWDLVQRVTAQGEVLGIWIDAHPLELVTGQVVASGAINTLEAAARLGQRVRVAGMRQTWRRSYAGRGSDRSEHIYFMSLEDLEGMLDVIISAGVYRRSRTALSTSGPYIIDGLVELRHDTGEPYIRAEHIEIL